MGFWGKTVAAFVLLTAVTAGAAEIKSDLYPSATVHYKMTVTIDTPEGLKSGSAVREVSLEFVPNNTGYPGGPEGHAGVKGEVVVVDLGKRGRLFALLSSRFNEDYGYQILLDKFPWQGGDAGAAGALTPPGIRWYQTLKTGKVDLQPRDYPAMVMSKVPDDPNTLQLAYVDRGVWVNSHQFNDRITDNLEATFGRGVKIDNVTIEITREPVTEKIKAFLPKFDGTPHLASMDDFVRGEK